MSILADQGQIQVDQQFQIINAYCVPMGWYVCISIIPVLTMSSLDPGCSFHIGIFCPVLWVLWVL